jgi:acetyl esterase/lipase
MMKILITSFLLALTAVLPAENNAQDKTDHALLTGKVENNLSNEIKFGNSVITIAKDGTFKFDMGADKPSFYNFNYEDKKTELFISPGDSLCISFNAKDFYPSLNITGINADYNMLLLALKKMDATTNQYLNNNAFALCSADPTYFTSKIDSIEQTFICRLDEFLKNKNNVNSWFVKKTRAEINFGFNGFKLVYPGLHKRFTGKAAAIDSNYFDNITKGTFNDPEFLHVESYNNYLNNYLDIQAAGKNKFDDVYRFPAQIKGASRYQAIYGLKANKEITDYLLVKYFGDYLGNYGTTGLEGILTAFKNECIDNDLKEKVLELYNKKLQERKEPSEIKIYKRIGDIELEAHIFYPAGFKKEDKRPAFLFFHGGGWSTGMPEWGYWDCKKYASKGMVTITFEYRLMDIYGNKIVDCVRDAKDAVYWVRAHANELGIDTAKIVASGFSAGAHLALCTALLNEYEDPGNDPKISCKPNALILGSASYSTEEWFNANSGTNPESISPYHQMGKNMVPTLMFHGKVDEIVSYEKQFVPFIEKMKLLNNKFTYHTFEGVGHFWFRDPKSAEISAKMTDEFLISLGYIEQK